MGNKGDRPRTDKKNLGDISTENLAGIACINKVEGFP
jgi:hypothetical protein